MPDVLAYFVHSKFLSISKDFFTTLSVFASLSLSLLSPLTLYILIFAISLW